MIRFALIYEQRAEVKTRLREIRNQPSVRRCMFTDHVISETEHEEWLRRLETDYAKQVKVIFEDDKVIGALAWENVSYVNKTCSWAYYLDEASRGKGIGLHCARYALRWAFDSLGMEKVNAGVLAFNGASWKNDLKIGMREEGRVRSMYVRDGARVDVVLLGITWEEWGMTQHGI